MHLQRILKKLIGSPEQELNESIDYTQADFTEFEKRICSEISPFTMTSKERIISLIRAVDYIVSNNIEGDIIECGVWKGGSSMAIAKTLINNNSTERQLYLYDTFQGMTEPEDIDQDFNKTSAKTLLNNTDIKTSVIWAYSELDEVKANLTATQYPQSLIHCIKGKVEETLPYSQHSKIALLRLDTDWYASTKAELEFLFPKLVKGGILIIDDYGHWQGARKAVDEYFKENNIPICLQRIDYTGRIAVKI